VLGCTTTPVEGTPSVQVDPLPEGASSELVSLAAPGLAAERAAEVLRLADGRPTLLIALAEEARALEPDDAIVLPTVAMRFPAGIPADLDPAHEDTLCWAAVLPEPFEVDDVVRVAGQPATDIAAALDELLPRGALVELPPPGPPRLRFRTALGRAQVRARLRPIERRRRCAAAYHHAASSQAAACDLIDLALSAGLAREVASRSIEAAAAERANERPERALTHAERALRWWTPEQPAEVRFAALAERGLALHGLSRWREAVPDLVEAAHGLEDAAQAASLIAMAGDAHWKLGDRTAALKLLTDYIDATADSPSTSDRAALIAQTAIITGIAACYWASARLAEQAHAAAAACGAEEAAVRALIALGLAKVRGRVDLSGLDDLAEARSRAASIGAHRLMLLALNNQVCGLLSLGRPKDALDLSEDALADARRASTADLELVLRTNRGEALLALGRLREAREELTRTSRAWRRLDSPELSLAEPYLAWLALAEGHLHDACDGFEALLAMLDDHPLFEQLAPLTVGYGVATLESGLADRAATAIASALGVWEGVEERLDAIPLLATASLVTQGEDQRWRVLLAELHRTNLEPALEAFFEVAEAGATAARAPEDARSAYRRASERFDAAGLVWWSAMAALWAGRLGQSAESADELRTARSRFHAMGASGWALRCEALLRARGERVATPGRRRRDRSEPTAREVEALQLLASGLGTHEIAERMVVTDKTVRRHLENVFAKLGVSNRVAAVRLAQERGLLLADDHVAADNPSR
jgi:DNA-binding CsgD family transcriptional regulator